MNYHAGASQEWIVLLTSSDCNRETFSMKASYILRLLKAHLSTIRRNVFLLFVTSDNNNVTVRVAIITHSSSSYNHTERFLVLPLRDKKTMSVLQS